MELHALRHLVFNEILGNHGFNRKEETDRQAATGSAEPKAGSPGPELISPVKQEPAAEVEPVARRPAKLSRSERFYKIALCFAETLAPFASQVWHQRKRLRLRKSRELRALREKCPPEKRLKFKAKRRDFSLEILCGNNLYDNIVRNSRDVLTSMENLLTVCRTDSPFSKGCRTVRFVVLSASKSPLQMIIKRVVEPVYECCAVGKVLRLTRKPPRPSVQTAERGPEIVRAAGSPTAGVSSTPEGQIPLVAAKPTAAADKELAVEKPVAKKRGRKPKQKNVTESSAPALAASEPEPPAPPEQLTPPDPPPLVTATAVQPPPAPARKGRPKKIRAEAPPLPKSEPSEAASNSLGVKTATDIFAFQCEEPNFSLLSVPKGKRLSEPTLKVKKGRKRCELSDDLSETEEQVPLKITFKRPSDQEFGAKRRKAIKLRVKTQTTKDNGFKIQINQPKTKNPLKFKLKASSKLFRKSRTCGVKPKDKLETPQQDTGCNVTLVVPGIFF